MADPVVPPSLQEDYLSASQSGDVTALDDVKTRSMGTAVAPKAQSEIDRLTTGVAPIQKALDTVAEKGGIQTRDGRIAAANAAIDSFKGVQPEVSFFKGFTQGLMGNKNWRNAATQGVIRPTIVYGNDGDFVIAQMAENSDVPLYAQRADGTPVNMQQWAAGGYQYTKPTETPGYQGKQETYRAYAQENAKEAMAANVGAAVFKRKAANADFIISTMQELKQYGLSNEELNQLTEESTREFSASNSIRTGLEQLKNANDSDSIRSALDVINGASGGLDGKVFKFEGNNKFSDQTGKSYTLQGLLQMGSSFNSASERQKRFTQSRDEIINSAVLKKLPNEEAKAKWQQAMDRIWQNDQLTTEFNEKYKGLPFISNPAPFKAGQSMKVAIANALQDQANAELAIAYQDDYQKAARLGMMVPGQAAANFTTKNPLYKQRLDELNADIAAINAAPGPKSATTPVATRELQPQGGGLQNIMSPSQSTRLGQTVGETPLSATPTGVPSNAKLVGRTAPDAAHPNGRAVYQTPDGTRHIGD